MQGFQFWQTMGFVFGAGCAWMLGTYVGGRMVKGIHSFFTELF